MPMKNVELYEQLIASTGEDIKRDGLLKTPERAAGAFSFLTPKCFAISALLSEVQWPILSSYFISIIVELYGIIPQ